MDRPVVAVPHLEERAAALAGELDHRADDVPRDLDVQLLVRLEDLAALLFHDHLRPRDLELVALATQGLDEDREMKLATPAHDERVRALGLGDAQGDVALQLREEALAELAARDVRPLPAGERARLAGQVAAPHRSVALRISTDAPRKACVSDRPAQRRRG